MTHTRAWRIHEFGGYEALALDEIACPDPGRNEVLVAVEATSINPVDYKTREGQFPIIEKDKLPLVLGRDVAGRVVATGEGVTDLRPGDRVCGMPSFERGSYAEYVVMDRSEVARLPDVVDSAIAGATPLAALTAWQGLFDHGHLTAGERVLVHGGAGGVGHFAVQFAKNAGATVVATGRADDEALLREHGASQVVDTDHEDFRAVVDDVDLVFDLLGGDVQNCSFEVLRDGGRLVSTLGEPNEARAESKHARTARYLAEPNSKQLEAIVASIADGRVHVHVHQRFDFEHVPDAQRALECAHSQGKIVVMVNGAA